MKVVQVNYFDIYGGHARAAKVSLRRLPIYCQEGNRTDEQT